MALAFLAVASLALVLLARRLGFLLDGFFGVVDAIGVVVVVGASVAGAFLSAEFIIGKALAVHLEALRFFAGASSFLFLDHGGRSDGFVVGV